MAHVYATDLWCRTGHFSRLQAEKCADLCAEINPRYAIETGFYTGRSSAAGLHSAARYLCRMISIEIDFDGRKQGRPMAELLMQKFPIFKVLEGSSQDILTKAFLDSEFPDGIDWATIDGDHSYEGCTFDLEAIGSVLNVRGLMLVDDYRSGPPKGVTFESVTNSADDFLARNSSTFHGEVWSCEGKGFSIIQRVR